LTRGWITSPEEPEGENTFDGFINSVRFSNSTNLRNLISNDPSQYDLVYVNWRNGTDFLQRNELVLEEVIRWVNQHKQPDLVTGLRNPNVVLGSSMGGVIARMALGRMDRAGGFAAHETNLYVSLDAPHQGANVPLGYQAAARHATKMYISTGGLAATIEIIQFIRNGPSPLLNLLLADQPASRQLLTNRIDLFYNTANATNQQFLQELRTQWAYPVNIRNIAISNGSECAIDQEFAAGSSLLYHYRSTKTRFIGDLISIVAGAGLAALNVSPIVTMPLTIPGSSKFELTLDIKALANGGGNQVYYGNIKITKKILWLVSVSINLANKTYNAPSGLLPFDTYPGGFYTVSLGNQPGSVSQDWMFSYNNSFSIQRRFLFIPTTSALDIGQGNTTLTSSNYLAKYIGAAPPAPPFNTPFINFTTAFNPTPIIISSTQNGQTVWQFTTNGDQPHEGLFIRSADWLAAELNGNINIRTDCSALCGNANILGKSIICNSEIYNTENGGVVAWSVSPTGIVTAPNPATGASTTLNRITDGTITLTASITSAACGSRQFSKVINVGAPGANISTTRNSYCNGTYQTWTLSAAPANGTNWVWSINYLVTNSQIVIFNPYSSSTMVDVSGGGAVRLNYTDLCGVAKTDGVTVYSSCPGSFRVAPNPTQDNITVSTDNSTSAKISSANLIYKIKITDRLGAIRKSLEYKTPIKSTTISTNGLGAGIYSISIYDGTIWSTQKLLVQ
jgi:hypothetical protein